MRRFTCGARRFSFAVITMTTIFIYTAWECAEKSKYLPKIEMERDEQNVFICNQTNHFPLNCEDDMTVVTAYFDIGSFQKGLSKIRKPEHYMEWSSTFKFLVNPLIVYTDSEYFASTMRKHREKLQNKTVIIVLKRYTLWSFRIIHEIRKIYQQPEYPKHNPNTVNAEYTSAMHAKYDVMKQAIQSGYFATKYYAWVDIGCFRDIVGRHRSFRLNAPMHFDDNKIAMSCVYNAIMNIDYKEIFLRSMVWVSGAVFIGSGQKLLDMEKQYKRAVNYFLAKGLMNTDEQILYAMYSNHGRSEVKPNVSVQLYIPDGRFNPYFYMGYICMVEQKGIMIQH